MPTSITRLSKFTIPIAGLNPRGAGLPTHNMISPAAGMREGKAKNDRGRRGKGEKERDGRYLWGRDEKISTKR